MSTSYIRFRSHGFWCPDALLEVFAYYLGQELQSAAPGWASDYGMDLVEKAQAGLIGCFDLGLDSLSEHNLALVEKASLAALNKIELEPSRLSARGLNELRLGQGSFSGDVPVGKVTALVGALRGLLAGRWSYGAGDDEALPSHWLR